MINPINVNPQGIGSSYGYSVKPKAEEKETKETDVQAETQQSQVSGDKILGLMAQSAASVKPAKTVDVAKFVDSESAQRIAGFMAQFEDKVAEGLKAFDEEFAGVDISDSAKMAVVLAGIDKEV